MEELDFDLPAGTEEIVALTAVQAGIRLDRYLAAQLPDRSRAEVQRWIQEGLVTVDGAALKASYKLQAGEQILVRVPEAATHELIPEPIPLDVVYEDGDVWVINKPAGLVVHPARGNREGTLVNGLLHHCRLLPPRGDSALRPGVVHRLDKATTGLLVFAKTDAALSSLGHQIEHRTVVREYLAFVWGDMERDEGVIDAPIGRHTIERRRMAVTPFAARTAVTTYEVLRRYNLASYLRLRLKTGRTHQIRVHMQHVGHPVVGDPDYGGRNSRVVERPEQMPAFRHVLTLVKRQALHAARLGFVHPRTHAYVEFTSALPEDMEQVLLYLERREDG